MTKGTKDITLNDLRRKDSKLDESDGYQIYHQFENICTVLDEAKIYCGQDHNNDFTYDSVRELYNKFYPNLKVISNNEIKTFKEITVEKNKLCIYLKYWFFDQIMTKGMDNSQIIQFFDVWNKLKGETCSDCVCQFYKLSLNEIKQIKYLYDYFLFYDRSDEVKEKNVAKDKIFSTEYCSYIKESSFIYSSRVVGCEGNTVNSYCKEFNEYIKNYIKFDDDELSLIQCPGDLSLVETEDIKDVDQSDLEKARMRSIAGNQFLPELEDDDVSSETAVQVGSTNGAVSTVLSLTFVATFFLLFLLYKFTPFRFFIDTQIHTIKNKFKNKSGPTKQLLFSNYENEEPNLDNNRYNIKYNSY
ncbi:PIR Superfamily Protein [Plasmodium ovale curtisi]|uniref:PIR Superfamily Protein n=1 Tax=Plasmodium ovale curtisi TaxID=864141 RepID=A0A1A8X9U4_PLAOA|nr:PIR Superfamily Protein [Plasmodium ovale curtisi]